MKPSQPDKEHLRQKVLTRLMDGVGHCDDDYETCRSRYFKCPQCGVETYIFNGPDYSNCAHPRKQLVTQTCNCSNGKETKADAKYIMALIDQYTASLQSDKAMLNELIVYAERYAIGRRSYANTSVADDVARLLQRNILHPKTKAVLARDIRQAMNDKAIPYEDQYAKWATVLARLSQAKDNTGKDT